MQVKRIKNEKTTSDVPGTRTAVMLNGKLLGLTVVVALLLASSVWVVRSWQLQRTAPVLLQRADAYESEENYHSAVEYVRRYLKLRPNDIDARIRLAVTFTKIADTEKSQARAVDMLYESLGVASDDQQFQLRTLLTELLLKVERFTSARLESDKLLVDKPQDSNALRFRALAVYGQLQSGVLDAKRESLDLVGQASLKANRIDPSNREVAGILAFAYRERPNLLPDAVNQDDADLRGRLADNVMDQMVAANPLSPKPYLTRYLYRVRYELPGIDEDLNSAIQHSTDDVETYLIAARHFHQQAIIAKSVNDSEKLAKSFEEASKHYQHILEKIYPQSEMAFVELGELNYLNSNELAAIECWKTGLQSVNEFSLLLNLRLAEAYLARKNLVEANDYLANLNRVLDETERGKRTEIRNVVTLLQAKVQFESKEYHHAITTLRSLADQTTVRNSVQAEAASLLGRSYSKLNAWEPAALAFERSLGYQPQTPNALWLAAVAWTNTTHLERGLERFDQLLERTDSPEVWYALAVAEYELQTKRPSDTRKWTRLRNALQQLDSACERESFNRSWRVDLLKADILLTDGNVWSETKPSDEPLKHQALALLKKAESNFPNAIELTQELVIRYNQLDQAADSQKALCQLEGLTSAGTQWKLTSALLAQQNGNLVEGCQILESIISDSDEVSLDNWSDVYRLLVTIELQQKSYHAAVSHLTEWRELEPENPEIRRTLASTLANLGGHANWNEALKLLSQSKKYPDQADEDTRLKGHLLVQRASPSDLLEATQIFDLLVNRSLQSTPDDRLMLAQLLAKQSKVNEAQRHYLRLVAEPDAPAKHIANYLEFLLKHKSAENIGNLLVRLQQLEPETLGTAVLTARVAFKSEGSVDVQMLNRIANQQLIELESEEKKAALCLAIGNLYADFRLLGHAEVWHRRLHELRPATFGILAMTLARQNKLRESIQLCHDSREQNSAAFAQVLATILTISSSTQSDDLSQTEIESMMSLIEQAIIENPNDVELLKAVANVYVLRGEISTATTQYRTIIQFQPNDVVALNNLATLMSENENTIDEAIRYVNKAISLAGAQPDLLDTLGMLLVFGGRASEAVPVLEQALLTNSKDPRIRFHLWAAYRASGYELKAQKVIELIDVANLDSQILTSPDRKLLGELKTIIIEQTVVTSN